MAFSVRNLRSQSFLINDMVDGVLTPRTISAGETLTLNIILPGVQSMHAKGHLRITPIMSPTVVSMPTPEPEPTKSDTHKIPGTTNKTALTRSRRRS